MKKQINPLLVMFLIVLLVAMMGFFKNSVIGAVGSSPDTYTQPFQRTVPYFEELCPGGYWTNLPDRIAIETGEILSGGRVCSHGEFGVPKAGETVPLPGVGYEYGAFDVGREWEKSDAVKREFRSPEAVKHLDDKSYVYQ